MYPADCLYSKDHEWLRVEGDEAVLGITHFAQEELGEVVYVELPDVGQSFDAGEEIGTIESVKAVAEVYAAVAGEIIEINEALVDAPEKLNDDPHGDGWLVRVKPSAAIEEADLMSPEQYQEFVETG